MDEERGNISAEEIEEYIKNVLEVLPQIVDLRLLLNMDECGFGKQTNYKKRRTCVVSFKCSVPPTWRGYTDNYHVSWVYAVSAAGTHVRNLFITT